MFSGYEFDRQFRRTSNLVGYGFLLAIGTVGFVGWLVYVLLKHWGVI